MLWAAPASTLAGVLACELRGSSTPCAVMAEVCVCLLSPLDRSVSPAGSPSYRRTPMLSVPNAAGGLAVAFPSSRPPTTPATAEVPLVRRPCSRPHTPQSWPLGCWGKAFQVSISQPLLFLSHMVKNKWQRTDSRMLPWDSTSRHTSVCSFGCSRPGTEPPVPHTFQADVAGAWWGLKTGPPLPCSGVLFC